MTTTTNLNDFKKENPTFDLDKFQRFEGTRKSIAPIIAVTRNGISFNTAFIRKMKLIEHGMKYVEIYADYESGQVMVMISNEERSCNAYSMSKKAIVKGSVTIMAKSFSAKLGKAFSYMNLANFNYKYEPELLDEKNGRAIITLNNPTEKTKIRRNA